MKFNEDCKHFHEETLYITLMDEKHPLLVHYCDERPDFFKKHGCLDCESPPYKKRKED